MRQFRGSRIFKRWETRLAINYHLLAMTQSLLGVLLLGHWMACFWTIQAKLLHKDVMTSWLGHDAYCTEFEGWADLPVRHPRTGTPSQAELDGVTLDPSALDCNEPIALYIASLYWAFATITSIGYGDISASEWNKEEQARPHRQYSTAHAPITALVQATTRSPMPCSGTHAHACMHARTLCTCTCRRSRAA